MSVYPTDNEIDTMTDDQATAWLERIRIENPDTVGAVEAVAAIASPLAGPVRILREVVATHRDAEGNLKTIVGEEVMNMPDQRWFEVYDNVVTLIRWMADQAEYSKSDLAYAVEKPWKYEDQYEQALTEESDRRLAQQPRHAF